MTVQTITLPPGFYGNGTDYSAKGRWSGGNRVRWHEGVLRPIGGFQTKRTENNVGFPNVVANPALEVIRNGLTWQLNDGNRRYIFGSNLGAYTINDQGVSVDITPAGFAGSGPLPTVNVGYGTSLYGTSTYGTARTPPISPLTRGVHRWKFDPWGEDIIMGPYDPEYPDTLYFYDSSVGTAATAIANAPSSVTGFVVTDRRIVMTINANDRTVTWSDREDFGTWAPTSTNYAGSQPLAGRGKLRGIVNVLNVVLILGDTDAHIGRWLGAPSVYGFNRIADDCGPWSGSSVVTSSRFAVWPGRRTFWIYDGTVRPLECPVQTYLDNDVDRLSYATSYGYRIPQFNEVSWHYKSKQGSEVDSYVTWNYKDKIWTYGRLNRTCGLSGEVSNNPVMVDETGMIYEHELDTTVISDAYAVTGPLELGQGEQNFAVRYVYPDTDNSPNVKYTFTGRQMPTDTEFSSPQYDHANPINTRFMAREIRMRVEGTSAQWRVGEKTRFDYAQQGTGRR